MQRIKGVCLLLVILFIAYVIIKLFLKARRCCRNPEVEFDFSPPPENVRFWKRIRRSPRVLPVFPPSPSTEPSLGPTEGTEPPPALPPGRSTKVPAPSRPPSYETAARIPGMPAQYWELWSSMANSSETNIERIIQSIKGGDSYPTVPPSQPTAPEITPDMESVMRQLQSESASNPGREPLPVFPQSPANPEPVQPAPADPVVSPPEPSTGDPASHPAPSDSNGGHRAIALPKKSGVPESLARLRQLIESQ